MNIINAIKELDIFGRIVIISLSLVFITGFIGSLYHIYEMIFVY